MAMTQTYRGGAREVIRFPGGQVEAEIFAGARNEIAARMTVEGVHPAVRAAADRCNAGSSWGGYWSFEGDQVSRVYGWNARSSERGRRLLASVGGF